MFRLTRILLAAAAIVLVVAGPLSAAGPNTMTYQGRLTNSAGAPLNGDFQVTFSIYGDSTGGFAYWSESQQIACVDGLFTVNLGSVTPIPGNAFGGSAAYLGISIEGDPEMSPRQRLQSVPYARYVSTIHGATGGQVNGNVTLSNWVAGQTAVQAYGGLYGGLFQAYDNTSIAVALTGIYGSIGPYDARGIYGESITADGYGIGGDFRGGWYGVRSEAEIPDFSQFSHYGVYSLAHGYGGSGSHVGLFGSAGGGMFNHGVNGFAYHSGTPGAYAYGVYGSASFGDGYGAWAGYFNGWTTCNGTLEVIGTLIKPGGAFRIDHPLDPENAYLQHSFVESPDMKNIYDGMVTTDASGEAAVTMPEWFSALNRDFRYQLTVIGEFAQAIVAKEMSGNQFVIRTDKPSVKVSWQVTGIRQDAYANAHRIDVVVAKKPQERGLYIDPVAFGKAPELQLHYKMNKAVADDRKANEARAAKNAAEAGANPVPTQR